MRMGLSHANRSYGDGPRHGHAAIFSANGLASCRGGHPDAFRRGMRPAGRASCPAPAVKSHGEKGGSPPGLHDPGRGLCQRGKRRPSDPLPSGEGARCDLFRGPQRALQGPFRKLPHQGAGPRQGRGDPARRDHRGILHRQPRGVSRSRRRAEQGEAYLREELVRSARSFLGVPYLWGGASAETGFDCSGLTMTVYQLNGLIFPGRPASSSWRAIPWTVPPWRREISFSSPRGRDKISHVGIYAGKRPVHPCPGKGEADQGGFSLERLFQPDVYRGEVVSVRIFFSLARG